MTTISALKAARDPRGTNPKTRVTMAQSAFTFSAGDQRRPGVASRAPGHPGSPPALALAMVSGDGRLVALRRGPSESPGVPRARRHPPEARRTARLVPDVQPPGRGRGRHSRYSPYAAPEPKLDLLRSVLERRLVAIGGALAARLASA